MYGLFFSPLSIFQEEQFRMKELADLAITLNMEAHETRQTEAENNKQLARTSKKDIIALQNIAIGIVCT